MPYSLVMLAQGNLPATMEIRLTQYSLQQFSIDWYGANRSKEAKHLPETRQSCVEN